MLYPASKKKLPGNAPGSVRRAETCGLLFYK